MESDRLLQKYEESMPWLKGMIGRVEVDPVVLYCIHDRMLSSCGECSPYADEAYKQYREERK